MSEILTQLDHLIVAVEDLEIAENNYKKLFGMDPVWSGDTQRARYQQFLV